MEFIFANLSVESDPGENENVDTNTTSVDPRPTNHVVPELLPQEEDTTHVRIPVGDARHLELMQYIHRHEKRGVFSTAWDGGLGLICYISDVYGHDWKHVTVLDIGAGTGLVGLGAAVASQGKAVVAVTDLLPAIPLLHANINLNQNHWSSGGEHTCCQPEAKVLEWGKPISKYWLRQFLDQASLMTPGEERTVLITGADVVYRKSLFEPLLATLCELTSRVREFTVKKTTKLECVLAVQAIRTHVSQGKRTFVVQSFLDARQELTCLFTSFR
eukprot:scaffold35467_cov199-Amphora_coffeaeformis.AAC.4